MTIFFYDVAFRPHVNDLKTYRKRGVFEAMTSINIGTGHYKVEFWSFSVASVNNRSWGSGNIH